MTDVFWYYCLTLKQNFVVDIAVLIFKSIISSFVGKKNADEISMKIWDNTTLFIVIEMGGGL